MLMHIDYCAYSEKPHWRIHAYTVEQPGDESVRDANAAEQMVRALVGIDEGDADQAFFKYGQPDADAVARFRIIISIRNTRRGRSDYLVDYKAIDYRDDGMPHAPRPLEVTSAAMECYQAIKANIKHARRR